MIAETVKMTPQPPEEGRKRSSDDFIFGKVIGEGSFSTVYLAKDIHTNKEFASKCEIIAVNLVKISVFFS